MKSKVEHKRPTIYQLIELIYKCPGMTSTELAEKVGINYLCNFNKRAPRLARSGKGYFRREWDKSVGQYRWWSISNLSSTAVLKKWRLSHGENK